MKKCKPSVLFNLLAMSACGAYALGNNVGSDGLANAANVTVEQSNFVSSPGILNEKSSNSQLQEIQMKENIVPTTNFNTKLDYSKVQEVCLLNDNYPEFYLFYQINTTTYKYKMSEGVTACWKTLEDGSLVLKDDHGNPAVVFELDPGVVSCNVMGCAAIVKPGEKFYTSMDQSYDGISLVNMQYNRFSGSYRVFDDKDPAGFGQYQNINFPAGFAGYKDCAHLDSSYKLNKDNTSYTANIKMTRCVS